MDRSTVKVLLVTLALTVLGGWLFFSSLPGGDGEVTCDGQVMSPGDYCGPVAGQPVSVGGEGVGNYDSIRAEQEKAYVPGIVLGALVGGVGLASSGLLLWAGSKGRRDRPDRNEIRWS